MGAALLALAIASTSTSMVAIAWADPSASDVASAKAALKEGRELRDKGDLQGALARFKAAYALVPTPITGLDLGKTQMALGQLLEAREVFVAIGKMPVATTEKEEHRNARLEADDLVGKVAGRIPSLTFRLPPGTKTAGLKVSVDDSEIPVDALPVPRKLNPGKHVIRASSTGTAPLNDEVTLAESEAREYALSLTDTGVPQTGPTPDARPPGPTLPPGGGPPSSMAPTSTAKTTDAASSGAGKVAGLVILGVGAVGMGVSGILGITAKSKWNESDAHCLSNNHCDSTGVTMRTDARSRGDTATIVLGIGAAVFVAGGAIFLLSPAKSESRSSRASNLRVGIGFGSVALGGTF